MKSFKKFCIDADIQEFWNPFASKSQPQNVLAYKNYKPGVLNKKTGEFTQRTHTSGEQQRYGWKPANVSSYSQTDTPGRLTASGEKFNDKQRLVAVPYASRSTNRPSIPFGTQLQMTTAPGTKAPIATTRVSDTGNFGPSGDFNKQTNFDLARQTAADVSGKPNITSQEFGKQKVYVRTAPTSLVATAKIKSPKSN